MSTSKLLSVPAGRSSRREGTKYIDARPTRGTIEIANVDGLLEFTWVNGESATAEESMIIFPGEAKFSKVSQDPSGRTHVLAFNSSDRKEFFWFQRISKDNDARDQVDIDGLVQDPDYELGSGALPVPVEGAPTPGAHAASTSEPDVSTGAGEAQGGQEEMARLIAEWARSGGLSQGGADDDARLTDVLSPANIANLLASKPDLAQTLTPLLPPGLDLPANPSAQDLIPVLSAPQFTDAIASLDNALRSGGLPGSMMRELGLPESAGTSVSNFLEALKGLGQQGGSGATGGSGDAMDTD